MSNPDILIRATEQCSKNTTCDGCTYHRMRGVTHCPIFDNVRAAVGGLYEENQKLRELLTIAKNDILWLILRRQFDMNKLNDKGIAALLVMNDKINDKKIDADFGAICDYLEGSANET